MEEIEQFTKKKDTFFILVGNKRDLEDQRVASEDVGKTKAEENNFFFYESSAKTGEHVRDMFLFLGKKILEHRKLI